MTKVLYPGSFDPITKGHMNVVDQACSLFDEVIVAVLINPNKKNVFFTPDERVKLIESIYKNNNKIKDMARHENMLTLEDILLISKKMLKNNGRISFIHRTERFVEIIELMKKYNLEPKRLRFVYSNNKKNSELLLIEGIKNGKPGLKLLSPLFIYDENGKYTKEIREMFGGRNS